MTTAPTRASTFGFWRHRLAAVVLLALALPVLVLGVGGYAFVVWAHRSTGHAVVDARATDLAPELVGAGPLLDLRGEAPQSRRVPAKTIVLTFDDGPDPAWTPAVLDVLARHGAHASFFVLGSRVLEHPDLVRRVLAAGNDVGSHTYTHVRAADVPGWRLRAELDLTQEALVGATGHRTALFRPPYSATPAGVSSSDYAAYRDAARQGYLVALADVVTDDWRPGRTADEIVASVAPADGAGAVVLLHDGGGDRTAVVDALDRMIPALQDKGYRFTSLSEAVGLSRAQVMPAAGGAERLTGSVLLHATRPWLVVATVLPVIAIALVGVEWVRAAAMFVLSRRYERRTRRRAKVVFTPPVSVIVPAFNESAGLRATVTSVLASDYPELEVVVVNDGSTDETAAIADQLAAAHPNVVAVHLDNGGKPRALRAGIERARHQFLVMIDGDTVIEPDAIGILLQRLADPTVGAVSGTVRVANPRRVIERLQAFEYTVTTGLDRRFYAELGGMFCVPGAIGAWRRRAVVDAGLPSGATLAEDSDLTVALARAGWRVDHAAPAIAWTEAPNSVRSLAMQRYRWTYGTLQVLWRNRGAVRERGPGGRVGRITYPISLLQIATMLLAPVVDVAVLVRFFTAGVVSTAGLWLVLTLPNVLLVLYGLRLEHRRHRGVLALPLVALGYRQFLYVTMYRSLWSAIAGDRLRWHRSRRSGIDLSALMHTPAVPVRATARRVS